MTASPPQPYVGLRPFRTDEHSLFFGRTRESLDIARAWRANKLTVLYGASGVGKTSLLQAGVIPTIDPERFDVLPVSRVRPDTVFRTGATGLTTSYTLALLSSLAPDAPAAELGGMTIAAFLRKRGERADGYGDPIPTLLAIDQGEELFSGLPTLQDPLHPFITELAEVLHERPGLRLLLSLREDYLAAVLPYELLLGGQARTRARLLPFGREAALAAIREPLKGCGKSFEPGAAEQLVDDLRTIKVTNARSEENTITVDSIEPVQVQVVCAALWASLPAEVSVITSRHVREHVDVDRFLASFCDGALRAVAAKHNVAAARIRSWLQQTFITELGTRGTAYQGIDDTAGMPNAVVRALENRHVLRAEHRSGTRWYELQHDRLIEPIRRANPDEHLEAARLASEDKDWDLVERHALLAIGVFGGNELQVQAEAEHLLGEVAQQRGQPDQALRHYRTAAVLYEVVQDSAAVGQLLAASGRLSLAHGRYAAAVADLRAAIAREPANLEAQTDLAQAMWCTGHSAAAVAVLDGVLAADARVTEARRVRGEILADLGQESALRDLDLVRRDQQPGTLAARALALAAAGRFDAAEQEAADALANGQDNGPVLLRVARVHALRGNYTTAARLAAGALAATQPSLPPHLREYAQRLFDAPEDFVRGRGGNQTQSA